MGKVITFSILGVLLIIILAVVLTSPLLRPFSGGEESVDISFTGLDGRAYSTAAPPFTGQVVLVDLMAANCPPCNAEMPELLAFRDSIRGESVAIISLSIWADQPGFFETTEDLEGFRERYGADWTFGVPDDTLSLVIEYNIQTPPFKILLDREGRVVWTKAGETTAEVLTEALNEAL